MVYFIQINRHGDLLIPLLRNDDLKKILRIINPPLVNPKLFDEVEISENMSLKILKLLDLESDLSSKEIKYKPKYFCYGYLDTICKIGDIISKHTFSNRILGNSIYPIDRIQPKNNYPGYVWGNRRCYWNYQLKMFEIFIDNKKIGYSIRRSGRSILNLSQYPEFLTRHKRLKKMRYKEEIKILRIISVYDKATEKMRFQVVNPYFDYSSVGYLFLEQKEKDELFLHSYELTKEIFERLDADDLPNLKYDFEKNTYFFEVIDEQELNKIELEQTKLHK